MDESTVMNDLKQYENERQLKLNDLEVLIDIE